jgi:hypothetical protein
MAAPQPAPAAAPAAVPKVDVIDANRVEFMTNQQHNKSFQGCLLVPKPGWPPTYIKVCSQTRAQFVSKIFNDFDADSYTLPNRDHVIWKDMLFEGGAASERAKFVTDTDSEVYFDWISSIDTTVAKNNKDVPLLEAMRQVYKSEPTIGVDTTRYLTYIGNKLLDFVAKNKLPLVVGLIALILLLVFLLNDDPRSFLPKETHKWFATKSPLKKVVEAGQYWDTHFGKNRPAQPYAEDLPPQKIQAMAQETQRPQFDRAWLSRGLPQVRDTQSLASLL